MSLQRRHLALALATLPLGCGIPALPPLPSSPLPEPQPTPARRPAAVGQNWTYRRYNGFNSDLLATEIHTVVEVGERVRLQLARSDGSRIGEEIQTPDGHMVLDRAWDWPQAYDPPLPFWPMHAEADARLNTDGHYRIAGESFRYWYVQRQRVVGWETIEVPAGRLQALRVEQYMKLQHRDFSRIETTRHDTVWWVPDTGRWGAREVWGEYIIPDDHGAFRGLEAHHRWELAAWA